MTLKQKEKKFEKTSPNRKYKISIKTINKFLAFFIAVLGVYFIISINDLSIKGFILEELKSKSEKLFEENNNMELAIMGLESYENIEKRAQDLKMVKVGKIEYITVVDEAVAKK